MQIDASGLANTATDNGMRFQISRLYNSNTLSDLTITCGDQKFTVHKVVLYTQSKYFRKLFGGPFKEASAVTIDLLDDDPYAIRLLIRYFYNNVLDAQLLRPDTHVHKNESAFLISLYAVADKYDVPRLRSLILERLNETCNTQHVPTFIDALLVVEQYTSDNAVWDILMPKIKHNLGTLLKNEAFRDVIMSQPAMTLQLLGSFASGAQLPGHSPPGSFTSTHPMSTSTVRGYAAGLRGARGGRGGRGARGISS